MPESDAHHAAMLRSSTSTDLIDLWFMLRHMRLITRLALLLGVWAYF